MKVFAILHEPASYTIDRNKAVYDPVGIQYAYMHHGSFAAADGNEVDFDYLPTAIFPLVSRLFTILRENDAVIMNGYTNRVFIVLFILNFFFGRAIGIDSDTQLSIPASPVKRMVKRLYLSAIFKNRNVFGLAGGTGSHKELFYHYGMPERHIFLMPMMVDNRKFYRGTRKRHDVFTFLYVGRLVECKNIDVLLTAFVGEFSKDKHTQLVIVGDGELLVYYQKHYKQYDNICFVGKRYGDDLVTCYHEADVLVLPSSYEPWGLVVNEAMSAGLPVIVSDRVGAAHDLVETRETGLIFHYSDAEALAEQLKLLAEDEVMRQRMSDNACHFMRDHWNYDLYKKCLVDFLEYVRAKRHC